MTQNSSLLNLQNLIGSCLGFGEACEENRRVGASTLGVAERSLSLGQNVVRTHGVS